MSLRRDGLPPVRSSCTNLNPATPIDGPFLPYRGLRSDDHRVALDVPPASSQCGYSADRAL